MDNYCIRIKNLDNLRITKVKDWAIYFNYKSKQYILHGSSELGEDSWQKLYERKFDSSGKCSLVLMKRIMYEKEYLKYDYIEKQNGKTIVYSLINKKHFVYTLTEKGFSDGLYLKDVEAKENEDKLNLLKSQLKYHEQKCLEIKNKIIECSKIIL